MSQLTPEELAEWQRVLDAANYNNIFCRCRQCNREWIASTEEPFIKTSRKSKVENRNPKGVFPNG